MSIYMLPNILTVWSNFEIADMDFWRSEAYTKFFEFLDSKGGFYYEVHLYINRPDPVSNSCLSDGEMHLFIPSLLAFS